MEFSNNPIDLPLDPEITRCLGHGHHVRTWCERRYQCAAHQTIAHDGHLWQNGSSIAVAYRKCMTETWASFLPMDGFKEPA